MRRALRQIIETEQNLVLRFAKRNSTWMMLAEFVHLEQLSDVPVMYKLETTELGTSVDLQIRGDPEALLNARGRWQNQIEDVSQPMP